MKLTSAAVTLALALFAEMGSARPGKRHTEVQGHRGAVGPTIEQTAYSFAYAMEVGVDVLEMDLVFTKDGVPVIWHDHAVSAAKCKDTAKGGPNFPYVGKFIANLTLAEVKTLDCGSLQSSSHPQQKLYPGATIQTLDEVLDLVDCYGNKKVGLNIETKLDPVVPNETLDVSKYINDIVPILRKRGFAKRVTIQSFDWRTIIGIKKRWPDISTVALLDDTMIVPFDRGVGGYPWLGGIDLDALKGDYVKAASLTKASILSTSHSASESSGSANSPTYVAFTTKDLVKRAHKLGMKVVPWTVDEEVTIQKLIDDGVDGIISNYPERALYIAHKNGFTAGIKESKPKKRCLRTAGRL